MSQHQVKIVSVTFATHDVLQIITEKPPQFHFNPGQAAEVSINKEGWKYKKRPFTFTSVPADDVLEFTMKTYPEHNSVTKEALDLKVHDTLIVHDVFGAIAYQREGVFIAGGAGITPFISILRDLRSRNELHSNRLIYANKTKSDIILEYEFTQMLGDRFINILSDETAAGYAHGLITEKFLRSSGCKKSNTYYLCGPPPMMESLLSQLETMNVDKSAIIRETF